MPKALRPRGKGPLVKLGAHAAATYEPIKVLGRGAFGTAFAVRLKADARMMVRFHAAAVWPSCTQDSHLVWPAPQVLKCVELGHMAPDARKEAFNECAVLEKLRDGPYIIRVSEHFEARRRPNNPVAPAAACLCLTHVTHPSHTALEHRCVCVCMCVCFVRENRFPTRESGVRLEIDSKHGFQAPDSLRRVANARIPPCTARAHGAVCK